MTKLIEIGMETLENVPSILCFIRDVYGYGHPIMLYAVDGDNKGFIIRNGNQCTYIIDRQTLDLVEFTLNDDNSLNSILKDDYLISYNSDDITVYTDINNNIEMTLLYDKYEENDLEGYDGTVVFTQYRLSADKRCEIHYPHMYRKNVKTGDAQIYPFNLRELQAIFIDNEYGEKGANAHGLIRRGSKYFHRITVCNGDIDYDIIALREYGLENFLKNTSYSLLKSDKVNRYCTIKLLLPSDVACTFFPLCKMYEEEDIKQYLINETFLTEVPQFVIDEYNGEDSLVNDIKEISLQIATIEKNKEENKRLTLVLHEE